MQYLNYSTWFSTQSFRSNSSHPPL